MVKLYSEPIREALQAAQPEHRATLMSVLYGEACTRVQAGRIMDRSADTVKNMLEDGRLRPVCEGTRVDVRSIARYMEAPKEADRAAQVRKLMARHGMARHEHV